MTLLAQRLSDIISSFIRDIMIYNLNCFEECICKPGGLVVVLQLTNQTIIGSNPTAGS